MKLERFQFVDWRPVATLPFEGDIMMECDWADFAPGVLKAEAVGKFSDVVIKYRYACRNDGFMLFEVEVTSIRPRDAITIAEDVSSFIKTQTKHHHIFDAPTDDHRDSDVSSRPVLIEALQLDSLDDLVSIAKNDEKMSNIKARSASSGQVSDQKALLTIKRLYSRIFDRVCRRAEERDQKVKFLSFASTANRSKVRAYIGLSCVVALFVILFAMMIDTVFGTDYRFVAVKIIIFGFFAILCYFHVKFNVNETLYGKVKLLRRLSAYCAHGNNLVRALAKIYDKDREIRVDEFGPIIGVTSDMISMTYRRIDSYKFSFTSIVAFIGLLLAMAF